MNLVRIAAIDKVKNKFRIHLNLAMVGVFSVVFFYTALEGKLWALFELNQTNCHLDCVLGKRAHQRGINVTQMNHDWHKEYNDPENVNRTIPEIRRDK